MTELPRIVRERLRMQASARVELHPDADLLTAFCERTLTENERQQVVAHLALCADCRDAVALAAPPQTMEAASGKPGHPSPGYGWTHWFALAASVVVVAAAITQIPRSTQRGTEFEVATKEQAPATATRPQAEVDAPKLADQAPALTVQAPASAKPDDGLAKGYDSKSPSPSDDKDQLKRDQVTATTLGSDFRENKQQARVASQPAAAPARSGDMQTGTAGGAGKAISGAPVAGASSGALGGIAPSGAASSGRARVDAPPTPPPAVSAANQVTAESAEENRRAGEAGKLKDTESLKSELAAVTHDEDRQRTPRESGFGAGQKEAAAQPPDTQEALDQKSRAETAAAQTRYRQPEVLPMKKHPQAPETPEATKTESSSLRAQASKSKLKAPMRWTVSSAGRVIRSRDGGKNWQEVAIAADVRFRAIAVQDATVWAGGNGGALFHSSDSGQTWTRRSLLARGFKAIEPGPAATAPAQRIPGYDIVRIDITAGGRVTVATSERQSFVSTDAGQTWSQQ